MSSSTTTTSAKDMINQPTPWQLRMFGKTLKKQQRLRQLRAMLSRIAPNERCLLVTCGDNNGAINWHIRQLGGHWTWADLEEKSIAEMSELLGDPVHLVSSRQLPFQDGQFSCVVTIDVLEHLEDPQPFTRELVRVTNDEGRVIVTVPGGARFKLANIIKNLLGMTKDEYGHARDGYSIAELKKIMTSVDLQPQQARTFSRFFTELVELAINYVYVKKLAKRSKEKIAKGTIAPATERQLTSVQKAYRLYSFIFPFTWLFSKLDLLLFFTRGYVVMLEGRKRLPA